MKTILRLILESLATKHAGEMLVNELKEAVSPLPAYLRRLGIGLAIIVASAIGWISGLIFLLVSFFLYIAGIDQYISAALWTSLVGFIGAIILVTIGFSLVKTPRR